jgi:peptidyl-prolyl cis-trans isomerase SurA
MLGKDNPNMRRATAIVNGDIITGTDVNQRLALILAANGGKVAPEEVERLRAQVLRNLIDETLQIQEAKNADIKIDEGEVEGTYARVAQENFKQEPAALDAYLARIGSSPNSLKRQIRGEMAWNRVLRRNVQPFVNVSQQEVKELLERMKASKGTEEYRLGEIYLSATPDSRSIVAENAQRIMTQLKEGGSFAAYARQYSEASTKAVGGDLGWIRLAQLPTELAASAREMQTGQLVGPIEMRGGFSILYLIDKRQVLTADPRDAVLALKQITLTCPPASRKPTRTKDRRILTAIKASKGCGGVDAVAGKLGAQVVANDQIRARDLPAPLQQSLLALSLGETTPPFGSVQEGIRMLMLCGRDDPKAASGPSFEELMSQMEEDRVNKRAQCTCATFAATRSSSITEDRYRGPSNPSIGRFAGRSGRCGAGTDRGGMVCPSRPCSARLCAVGGAGLLASAARARGLDVPVRRVDRWMKPHRFMTARCPFWAILTANIAPVRPIAKAQCWPLKA